MAETVAGRAQGVQLAVVDGAVGAVWATGGTPRTVFNVTIVAGKIVAIDLIGEPALLPELDVRILDDEPAG